MRTLWLTLRQTAAELIGGSQRGLWAPFCLIALVEAMFLGLLWLSPHPPFSSVLAPPIRYFFGDRVLHYPAHLWFLYHAMKHTHVAASAVAGAYLTGVACAMVRLVHEGAPPTMREALVRHRIPYVRLVLIWIVSSLLARAAAGVSSLAADRAVMLWGAVGATVALQALLAYAIPAAVFNGSAWWKAILESVREARRFPGATLGVIVVPSALVILAAVLVSPAHVARWMLAVRPEVALACVAGRLLVWTLADALLTVGVAHLWWFHRAPSALGAFAPEPGLRRDLLSEGDPVLA